MQQRTEVVDDASWIMGFLDIIDPAIDSIKRLLNIDQAMDYSGTGQGTSRGANEEKSAGSSPDYLHSDGPKNGSSFDLDKFVHVKLSLDPSKLDIQLETSQKLTPRNTKTGKMFLQNRGAL